MVVTAKSHNEKMKKKISTKTPTFSSLEKENITTTIINNNIIKNNNHNNSKNNTIYSKGNNNTLIKIGLPKTDAKFNYAAIKEEKVPVLKKALLRQNTNLDKYSQKNQIRLHKLEDGKSIRQLESDNSSRVLHKIHVLDLCNEYLWVAIYLYKLLPDFCFFLILFFSFLFRNFTVVDEPPLKLNFYNYSTIARIFSCTDYIDFYEKYFFKYEALRIDLENRHITLHSKLRLNLTLFTTKVFFQ